MSDKHVGHRPEVAVGLSELAVHRAKVIRHIVSRLTVAGTFAAAPERRAMHHSGPGGRKRVRQEVLPGDYPFLWPIR
jgi:hypothetical protein